MGAVTIIDISNKAVPSFVGLIQGNGSPNFLADAYSIFKAGSHAYVGAITDDSLTVIDVSSPNAPFYAGRLSGAGSPNYMNYPYDVFVLGDYAYVVTNLDNSFVIIDISSPISPSLAGILLHGGGNVMQTPKGVCVVGDYAFVAASNSQRVVIVDVSNKASPSISGFYLDATDLSQIQDVYAVGNYAFAISGLAGGGGQKLVIIDITNKASPSLAGDLDLDALGFANPFRIYVVGDYAYITVAGDALIIIDVSNKASPSLAGSISGAGSPNYLDLPTGIFVESDGSYAYVCTYTDDSLVIIDLNDKANPALAGVIRGIAGRLNACRNVHIVGNYAYVVSQGGVTLPAGFSQAHIIG